MSFSLNATDCKHLKVIIISMVSNKASRIDKIPIRVIKDSLGSILPVLTSVINTSIATNMFPTQWTPAKVTTIPKDIDYEQVSNNRLISLLPIVLKVCERVVYNQFASYLTSEGRLSNNQNGNKKFHSTRVFPYVQIRIRGGLFSRKRKENWSSETHMF